MAAHLSGCGPCRAECDALKEVDRRVQRLGQTRRDGAAAALRELDQRLAVRLGPARKVPVQMQRRRPLRRGRLLVLLSLGAVLLAGLGLLLRLRGH